MEMLNLYTIEQQLETVISQLITKDELYTRVLEALERLEAVSGNQLTALLISVGINGLLVGIMAIMLFAVSWRR